jgi:hypothetical protein
VTATTTPNTTPNETVPPMEEREVPFAVFTWLFTPIEP